MEGASLFKAQTLNTIDPNILFTFASLFEGNRDRYGQTKAGVAKEGEKTEAESWLVHEPLVNEQWESHLTGRVGLGVVPIYDEQYVHWSVIDVDEYGSGSKLKNILNVIDEFGLPFVPFRSKSGGLHLYTFYSDADGLVRAEDAIKLDKEFLAVFGLPKKTEIFPKQSVLKADNKGSWINLPYFGGDNTNRYMLTKDLERVSLMVAVTIIVQRKYTIKQIRAIFDKLPLADGPPCLQNMYMGTTVVGKNDGRNNYMFSLGRYYKTKDENNVEDGLREANDRLPYPLPESEISATVKSVINSSATYLCKREPLLSICNNSLCKMREFGIEHVDISNFNFGQLTKFETEPPYYVWEIDGQKMEFFSEKALRDQKEFGYQSMRYLHRAPRLVKDLAWVKILNTAFDNMKVERVEKEDDFSQHSILMGYTVAFMETNAVAYTKDQIEMGSVYKDMDKKRYLFKTDEYYRYIRRTKGFTTYQAVELGRKLKNLGGKPTRIFVKEVDSQIRCWELPFEALTPYMKLGVKGVDFLERAEEDEFGDY